MKANALKSAVAVCGLVFIAHHALGQDWPQWRGVGRDAKAAAFSAPATWPQELTQKWKVNVGKGDSTPALAGDRLYVFARQEGREVALCLDAASGKEIWREQYDSLDATGAAARHSGPRSSPTVVGGKIVVYGVRGNLTCLDADKGKVLWRKNDFAETPPRFFTASSPLVVDGLCIAQLGGEEKGGITAYDLATGEQKWTWTGEGTAYSSPVAASIGGTRQVIALAAKSLVGLAAKDGKLLWQAPFPAQGRAYNAATPIVDGNNIIFAGAGRGTKKVSLEKSGDKFEVKELWSNPDNAVQFNTPVLKQGKLYGISQAGDLFCLNAEDGKTLWTSQLGGKGGFGSVIDAGTVLMAMTPQAQLVVFEPNDKELKKLASYKVAESDTYAYPVLSGNRIYIKDQDALTLWTLGAP